LILANSFSTVRGMKPRRLNRTRLLEMANEYAAGAVKHLTFVNRRDELELEQAREGLRVHFLFPNCNDEQRALLLAMALTRRGFNLMVNVCEPARYTRDLDRVEQQFCEMRSEILQSGLMEGLTSIQRAILQKEFFQIRFSRR